MAEVNDSYKILQVADFLDLAASSIDGKGSGSLRVASRDLRNIAENLKRKGD